MAIITSFPCPICEYWGDKVDVDGETTFVYDGDGNRVRECTAACEGEEACRPANDYRDFKAIEPEGEAD